MAELFLGIDGGGSKTRAVLADRDRNVLGTGVALSSNYQSVGFEAATGALQNAIAKAKWEAGVGSGDTIIAACFGLAGVDRPVDRAMFEPWIVDQRIAKHYLVVNDAELVLAAGTPDGWGMALICGTGSICYGRAPNGQITRSGGWGHLLGDEGSGYEIAKHALQLATQTADGRADAHALLAAILNHWQLDEPEQIIGYVYHPDRTRAEIAQLAARVMTLAESGDQAAQAILERAAHELGRLIAAVVRKLSLDHPPLAIGGGVISANRGLQDAVRRHAGIELGPITHVDDAARGALILAQRLAETSSGVE